jgi:hypothetical protein
MARADEGVTNGRDYAIPNYQAGISRPAPPLSWNSTKVVHVGELGDAITKQQCGWDELVEDLAKLQPRSYNCLCLGKCAADSSLPQNKVSTLLEQWNEQHQVRTGTTATLHVAGRHADKNNNNEVIRSHENFVFVAVYDTSVPREQRLQGGKPKSAQLGWLQR